MKILEGEGGAIHFRTSVFGGSGNDSIIAVAGVDVLFGQSALEAVFGKEHEGESVREDVLLG